MDRKPGSPSPSSGNGNGSKANPTAAEPSDLKPSVQIRANASTFELFSKEASAEELRALVQVLNEWAGGDQKGFPCQFSLITRNQFRSNAAVPIEVARVLDQHKRVVENSAQQIGQVADTAVAELRGTAGQLQTSAQEFDATVTQGKGRIEGALKALETSVGRACVQMEEERVARNQRTWAWALGTAIVLVGLGWWGAYRVERAAGETRVQAQIAQLEAQYAQKDARLQQQAQGQAATLLQQLEPASYRLAQQVEHSRRQVRLPDGQTAWEVTLFDEPEVLSVEVGFDAQTIRQRYTVRLHNDPARLALSATAPAASSGTKDRARP